LMTAVSPADYRLKIFASDGGKQDTLELVDDPKASTRPRLRQCMTCHGRAGTKSLGDVTVGTVRSVPRLNLKSLQRRSQSEIVQATAKAKRDDESWKLLQTAWEKANR
jgi:cytochrome c553